MPCWEYDPRQRPAGQVPAGVALRTAEPGLASSQRQKTRSCMNRSFAQVHYVNSFLSPPDGNPNLGY